VTVDGDATWHLFAGDESFLPAACAMAESLADPARATLVISVDSSADEVPGVELPGLRYVHRGGASAADAERLVDALAGVELGDGAGRAYLAAELSVVSAMRASLLDRGLDATRIAPKSYWRAGVANASHGEPGRD
jgi:NADPH-dependent ferric siderophore reductase